MILFLNYNHQIPTKSNIMWVLYETELNFARYNIIIINFREEYQPENMFRKFQTTQITYRSET